MEQYQYTQVFHGAYRTPIDVCLQLISADVSHEQQNVQTIVENQNHHNSADVNIDSCTEDEKHFHPRYDDDKKKQVKY